MVSELPEATQEHFEVFGLLSAVTSQPGNSCHFIPYQGLLFPPAHNLFFLATHSSLPFIVEGRLIMISNLLFKIKVFHKYGV